MDHASTLRTLLSADPIRMRILGAVRSLDLPEGWIAAGFVRNAVWDHLHGHPAGGVGGDVDVIWFCRQRTDPAEDTRLEAALRNLYPGVAWSVKNQARMHARNGDEPYASATDAMRFWPETATAVAVRLAGGYGLDVAAPFGLDDLFGLVLRPIANAKRPVFLERMRTKRWLERWPMLRIVENV